MKLLELSLKDVEKETKKLAEIIADEYRPDLVVYVAKGAYSIGIILSKYFRVPVFEIFAVRKGDKIKKVLSPVLKVIPSRLKSLLREKEVKANVHTKNKERNVYWGYIPEENKLCSFNRILLVDDSCDTGHTFVQCINKIKESYTNAQIKTAALNVFSKSESVIKTDYYLHKNYLLSGPWSNDSKEHSKYIHDYELYYKKIRK